jgi:hypothetical protein
MLGGGQNSIRHVHEPSVQNRDADPRQGHALVWEDTNLVVQYQVDEPDRDGGSD